MPADKSSPDQSAAAQFRRMMRWIAFIAVLMVIGALTFLHYSTGLTIHMVVATVAGTFFSVVLGCGLFALAFFSDKSGHDQNVTDATRGDDPD
jgi:hypothetical protein